MKYLKTRHFFEPGQGIWAKKSTHAHYVFPPWTSPAVCTLPMVPCGSSPVTRFALASATRKTKRLRRRLGSEAAQWNAYCSVIKAQKSYQKACITEGLSLIKDHNEWSFQSQIKTQDLSSIDGCLLISLWLTLSYAQRHWLTLVANSLRASNFSYHYYFWFSNYH